MTTPWLVVGLGNPGPTYAITRHNVGFFVVDELASRASATFSAPRGKHADLATARLGEQRVVLAKPRTFMNDSGRAVRAIADFHKITPDHIVAVHDELDLDFGQLRLKLGGGDNGHNGLKSIRAHLGSGDFHRVRFGIGRPPGRQPAADFVLQTIPVALREDYTVETSRVADAVQVLLTQGLQAAQNQFNS